MEAITVKEFIEAVREASFSDEDLVYINGRPAGVEDISRMHLPVSNTRVVNVSS